MNIHNEQKGWQRVYVDFRKCVISAAERNRICNL